MTTTVRLLTLMAAMVLSGIVLLALPAIAESVPASGADATAVSAGVGVAAITYLAKTVWELVQRQKRERDGGTVELTLEAVRIMITEVIRAHAREEAADIRELTSAAAATVREQTHMAADKVHSELIESERRGDAQRTQFLRTQEMQTELLRQQTRLLESMQHEIAVHGAALRGIADRMERT